MPATTPLIDIITGGDEAQLPDFIARFMREGRQLRVCSWCQTPLMRDVLRTMPVTHGICDPCYQREIAKVPPLSAAKVAHGRAGR